MDNTILIVVIVGVSVFLAGLVIALISVRFIRTTTVSRRLQDFVVDYSRVNLTGDAAVLPGAKPIIIQEPLQGSFLNRTLIPLIRRFVSFLGRFTPQQSLEGITRQLLVAGVNLRPVEFVGIRVFTTLIGIALAGLLFYFTKRTDLMFLMLYLTLFILFFLAPIAWLQSKVRQAQEDVRAGLPDALDMLSVCTYAGLGFDQALQRVSDYWHTALGGEFRRVVQEIELGVSRADALRSMAQRLQVNELSSFVAVIVQSETLGMPISDVLHGQAEQMRIIRQFKAKESASRLPAKMMFPLAFLILPALMAVILSPTIPSLLGLFGVF